MQGPTPRTTSSSRGSGALPPQIKPHVRIARRAVVVAMTVLCLAGVESAGAANPHTVLSLKPSFTYSPSPAVAGEPVTFDASSSSTKADGWCPLAEGITSYEWDLDGDGTFETGGVTATHTYATPGNVNVSLRVTDECDSNTLTKPVQIGPGDADSLVAAAESAYEAPDGTIDEAQQVVAGANPDPATQDVADNLDEGFNLVKGVKEGAGGCGFELAMRVPHEMQTASADEVGYDPTTCVLSVVVTMASEVAVSDADAGVGPSDDPLDPGDLGPCFSPNARCSTNYKYTEWEYKVWYTDPPGFALTNHIQDMGWHYGNGCVHNPIYINEWDRWLEESTWWLRSKNSYADASCGSTYISAYRHFQNDYFCAGTHTHLEYDRQVLMGHANGDAGWSVHVHKQGICEGALTMHTKATKLA